jgi:hypothetical protein
MPPLDTICPILLIVSIPVFTVLVQKSNRKDLPRLLFVFLIFVIILVVSEIFLLFGVAYWTAGIALLVTAQLTIGYFIALSRIEN